MIMNKLTRFELFVDGKRKIILNISDMKISPKSIEYDLQDNNQTMKVFVS